MLFNSPVFLFLFLPAVLVAYYAILRCSATRAPFGFLVLASLFFYGWWEPRYLALILGSIVFNYAIARGIQARRRGGAATGPILAFGVTANLVALGAFKYANFFLDTAGALAGASFTTVNIVLPLAISFFTFQQIAFLADVHKGKAEEPDFLSYCLFVTFFPQLIAGPIVHHSETMPQFRRDRLLESPLWDNLAVGATILTIGLFKKTVLADKMATWADRAFLSAQLGAEPSFFEAWIGAACFSFEIYFDFSGYSDMAIGLARMFGILLPLNFNAPYKATSIIDFWRCWHMTLSRFLRDYLYFPLGGGRHGKARRYANLMIVMVLGGLWHGAAWTFVLWGGLHGLLLVCNHAWRALKVRLGWRFEGAAAGWAGRVLTLLCVSAAWTLFRADSLPTAIALFKGLAGLNGVVVPIHYAAYLSAVSAPLEGLGVEFGAVAAYGGGRQLVWLLGMLVIVWGLPSTQEIMRQITPALDFQSEFANQGTAGVAARLVWRPSAWLGLITGLAATVLAVRLLEGQSGEFVYFQF